MKRCHTKCIDRARRCYLKGFKSLARACVPARAYGNSCTGRCLKPPVNVGPQAMVPRPLTKLSDIAEGEAGVSMKLPLHPRLQ